MNLHDRAEFEKQLTRYLSAHNTLREHNARVDLVNWVAKYADEQVAATVRLAWGVPTSIEDSLGGP